MTDTNQRPASEDTASDPKAEGKGDAGQDKSIARRLEKHPESKEARLDRGLDESMDASDPPASTQPVHQHQPPASSGYDEAAERELREKK